MQYTPIIKPPASKIMKSGRVILDSGEDVGQHATDDREELILVLRRTATIILSGEKSSVPAGSTKYIGANIVHNVKNETTTPLEYIYVVALFDGEHGHSHEHNHEHSHGHEHSH